ncbi:allantoinase AllB [Paenibacillus sp. PK3_47]|uniref:allantoinase AllB n=1 Tax=Paenibacillus sp. PK3_47 TaxID=2072642 RepID=UPI00201E1829|nr:allantoinase AllB [Paenibacillus sp. PK3_47]UQZ37084.1 allantoinase AllB [Paenibacillus sp. PK3_47]
MGSAGRYDLVITGGAIVTETDVERKDIGILDGRITEISTSIDPEGAQVIDGRGLTVMPGVIDTHVHFNEPGLEAWEGLRTGSAALAAGGGTSFLDMPLNALPPTVTVSALQRKRDCAKDRTYADYGFWGGLMPGYLKELPLLADAGVMGFKAFMSSPGDKDKDGFRRSDDDTLREGMKIIAQTGKILALHAEHEPTVSRLTLEARSRGQSGPESYTASRPVEAEVEAVEKALHYAAESGCRLHFVHISSESAAGRIRDARKTGLDVTLETCPHYLCLTDKDFAVMGAVAKCAPPLRDREEQGRLWNRLQEGWFDYLTSDHSPCPPGMKAGNDLFEAWGGIAGVQSTLTLMLDEGHLKRGISLPVLARLLSGAPAERFGFAHTKGRIAAGCDADLALVDLNASYTLHASDLYQRHRQSPYIGRSFGCKVKMTLLRGRLVYSDGTGLHHCGAGRELTPVYPGVMNVST